MGAMRLKLAFLPVFLLSGPALAQQLVTFDQVVTITQAGNGAGAFHYLIKPAASEPASWTTPVDYSKGTAYVHMEVMEKPSQRNTTMTICFDGNLEGYGCITTPGYTAVGTHDSMHVLPTATWQYNKIAWNRRRQEYHLVVKDPALGGTPGGRPATDYVPTKMRIVMTVVPPGGTYTPPMGTGSPASDAGATDAGATGGRDGATARDAMSGTGGSAGSGSGGSGGSGSGGSSGAGGTGPATGGSGGSTGGAGGGGSGGSATGSGGFSGGSGASGSGAGGSSGTTGGGGAGAGAGGSGSTPPRTRPPAAGGCSVATVHGNGGRPWLLLAAALIPGLLRRRRQEHRSRR